MTQANEYPIPESIRLALQHRIQANRIPKRFVARSLGVSLSTLEKWLSGKTPHCRFESYRLILCYLQGKLDGQLNCSQDLSGEKYKFPIPVLPEVEWHYRRCQEFAQGDQYLAGLQTSIQENLKRLILDLLKYPNALTVIQTLFRYTE